MMKIKWPIIIAAFVAFCFVITYPVASTIVLLIVIAAGVFLVWLKKRKEQAEEQERLLTIQRQEQEREERNAAIRKELEIRKKQFRDELESVPQVDITVSRPAARQYLKDMPEYSFSNITAKTKLSTIFPLVVLDVETTGLTPSSSEVIEVSAIKFDVGMIPVECFTTLCRPKRLIPPEVSAINHITDDMVENAPSFRQVAPALSEFIKDCNLVGHNLEFDLRFLYVHGTEIPFGKRFFDTLEIAQHTIRKADIGNHKLDTLCSWYGIWRDDAHRALSDSYATAKIFTRLIFDKTSRDLEAETGE